MYFIGKELATLRVSSFDALSTKINSRLEQSRFRSSGIKRLRASARFRVAITIENPFISPLSYHSLCVYGVCSVCCVVASVTPGGPPALKSSRKGAKDKDSAVKGGSQILGRFVRTFLHAGHCGDPVYFPGFASVSGEGLFEVIRIRSHV